MVKHRGGVCARGLGAPAAGRAKRARRGIGLAGDLRGWSAIACGGEKSPIGDSLYGSPPWRSFYSCKRNQNTLGALPQDPCRWLCWIRIDLRREPEINPYCAQNRSQGSHGRICPFPPPPFPMAGKGPGWAGKCRAAVRCSGYVRACGGGGSRWLGCGTMTGRKMSR